MFLLLYVFPTPVGMNRQGQRRASQFYCVPHTRGDEPFMEAPTPSGNVCSPHPWG